MENHSNSMSRNAFHASPGPASLLPQRICAAPSWVLPGTVAENCVFLAGRNVEEAGLLFMESAACLAYTEADLPPALAELPLSFHVHLPVDLPMSDPVRAASICGELLDKVAFLPGSSPSRAGECRSAPLRGVLHPPAHDPSDSGLAARRLEVFARSWGLAGRDPSLLLLENVRDNDLTRLSGPVEEYSLGLCLDMGHVLAYGQQKLLARENLLQRVEILHVNAPGVGSAASRHLPLTALDTGGRAQAERMCRIVPRSAVIMMELFSWREIEESLPLARSWLCF